MKDLKNFHAITVKYIGPTNSKGSRVSITSDRFNERILIAYNYTFNNVYTMAQAYLLEKGFKIVGMSEIKHGYIILSTSFKSIK